MGFRLQSHERKSHEEAQGREAYSVGGLADVHGALDLAEDQQPHRDPATVVAEKKRAIVHLEFCVELYREQMRHGRYFVHEHPAYATSWQEASVENLLGDIGVEKATCDQCFYGSTAEIGGPVKKPTTFMTNSTELSKELRDRCQGRG